MCATLGWIPNMAEGNKGRKEKREVRKKGGKQ
jgi:hypothetical protein